MSETEKLPTLGELGQRLPIGYVDDGGKRHVDFTLVQWDWAMEEKIGALAERNPNQKLGAFTTELMAHAIATVGPLKFQDMDPKARVAVLKNMFFADVLTMFIWTRVGALGPEIQVPAIQCTSCQYEFDHKNPFVGDIRGCEIKVMDNVPTMIHTVKSGFQYQGKQWTKIAIGPLKWEFWHEIDEGTLANKAKYAKTTVKAGVIGLAKDTGERLKDPQGNLIPFAYSDDLVRSLGVPETTRLVRAISDINGGPVMSIDGTCPKCSAPFDTIINWTYPSFFGSSFR